MAVNNSVKDPKNGVVSCWVCTGALILMDVLRLTMLSAERKGIDWTFIVLIAIWVVISVYQTVKYKKGRQREEKLKNKT